MEKCNGGKTMLDVLASGIQYVLDMGASVMLPIVIAVICICMGIKAAKAIQSGLMIGVGFVGLTLLINMMNDELGPAAQAMSERFGLTLSVVDIGWPGASPMTWASNIATISIPVAILINVIMLLLKLTRTVNIDVWNIWHMTFTGAIAYTVTDNFWIGILGVAVHAALTYKLGDLWAPLMHEYFGLDGLTVPHGGGTAMAPIAYVIDDLLDRIPGIRKINITAHTLQEKIGVFGQPIVIGGILGTLVGFLAGYRTQEALPLGINMAAIMVLMPKVVSCITDGLVPLSERAKELLTSKFGNAEFYIGMDPAILLQDSQVITAGLLFIPLTLIIAVLVPGNQVLPFGDLATIGFFTAVAVAVHKGNLFRTMFSGSVIMYMTVWIANETIPWLTALAKATGMTDGTSMVAALDQGGSPVTYLFTQLFVQSNLSGAAVIAGIYGAAMLYTVWNMKKQEKRAYERKGETDYEVITAGN